LHHPKQPILTGCFWPLVSVPDLQW